MMSRPNILWIQVDDISPFTGCHSEAAIETPNIDRLAKEGVRFRNAFSTSPVCSPARSAAITGMYQTSINAHNHRSYRYQEQNPLPGPVTPVPRVLQQQGYYTVLAHVDHPAKERYFPQNPKNLGKSDYNFAWDQEIYDAGGSPGLLFDRWTGHADGQPFFAQVQLRGGKHRPLSIAKDIPMENIDMPPYYPRHPVFLERWAGFLASLAHLDKEVGLILDQLEANGSAENTVVFFFADHGIDHLRHKQTLYDGGIHIPLILRWPNEVAEGTEQLDLVMQIDIAASTLHAAGLPIPSYMHGIPLTGSDSCTRKHVFSARDRSGTDIDRVRSVRTHDYKYIRNYHPDKPYFDTCNYMYRFPTAQVIRNLHASGELDSVQERFLTSDRPPEELYDLNADPHETVNLAASGDHQKVLTEMQARLKEWSERYGDDGERSESEVEIKENTWHHRQ